MTKNKLKYTFILLLCLAISEIINGIIFVLSLGKDNYFNGSEEGLMILISLILYFVTGKFIVSKFNDRKKQEQSFARYRDYNSSFVSFFYGNID